MFIIATIGAALLSGTAPARAAVAQAAPGAAVPSQAMAEFDAGRYESAARMLHRALEAHPDDAALYHWLSRCELELGDTHQAVKDAGRAVDRDPAKSEYHRWFGRALGAEADRTHSFFMARKVKEEFEKAIALDPGNVAARRDAMEFYLEAPWIVGGSHDKARDEAKAISSLDPMQGALADASCDAHEDKDDAAAADYRRALAMKPATSDPYFDAAAFYTRHRQPAALRAVVAQARTVAPDDPRLDYYHGVAAVLDGQSGEAETALQTYLAHAPARSTSLPSHSSAHLWLGRSYEQQGEMEAAADQYRIALALDPDQKAAREGLDRVQRVR